MGVNLDLATSGAKQGNKGETFGTFADATNIRAWITNPVDGERRVLSQGGDHCRGSVLGWRCDRHIRVLLVRSF